MKQDIFDTEISIYNGVRDVYGTTCKLRAFLFDKKHVSEVEQLRSLPTKEERNEIKKRLPQACISGVFSLTRKAENLVKHSGLICVDIDQQDNLHIDNWDEVKQVGVAKPLAYLPSRIEYFRQKIFLRNLDGFSILRSLKFGFRT